MDEPFEELAKVVGKVLAKRWLNQDATGTRDEPSDKVAGKRPVDSPTDHFVDQTDARETGERV